MSDQMSGFERWLMNFLWNETPDGELKLSDLDFIGNVIFVPQDVIVRFEPARLAHLAKENIGLIPDDRLFEVRCYIATYGGA